MKRVFTILAALLITAVSANAQTILKGDMNDDGQVSIADVTSVVNVILGKAPQETISVGSNPFAVDNSLVVGTWYATDGSHFTLSEDGTTDFPDGVTYKFYTGQNRLVILNASERAVRIIPIVEATSSYLLTVDYVTGAPVYYTKSNSLCQVTGVTLNQTTLSMNSGTTAQLSATVAPSSAFNQAVEWTSSDENVATVDQNGLVTAVAGGSCTITATSTDGSGVSATCTVSVTQMVTDIVLSPKTLFLKLDEFVRLSATVLPETAANKNVVWSSSNEDVATVRSGRIDAFGYGSAVVTCTAADGSGVYAKCMVYVIQNEDELYVDLGLPSGTLWATMNVGATSPEDYGDYFAWGETEGYNDGKTTFNWSTYKWCEGSDNTMTKYCNNSSYGYNGFTDDKTELDLEDDAAYVNWGPDWRMPSHEQFSELINSNYTITEWTTQNGVYGRKITSKTNGNSIFLPAAGYRISSSLDDAGSSGYYWSRALYTSRPDCAGWGCLSFGSNWVYTTFFTRYDGRSVRPVRSSE
ncbi:MAG: Ig domain-containing protein [Bacteroidaceae bacterium]|nr:Ig domain-containing protein [Bacteroidaceae bacterium]